LFGVTLHAANTEHEKKIFLFVRNKPTGGLHRTANLFFKKSLESQHVWASKNINNKPENVKKNMINDKGKV
jgi:hypothetical protein